MKKAICFIILIFLCFISNVISASVCTLNELIRELQEDIEDNGKLDCLRTSVSLKGGKETIQEKEKRIKGMWDSECAFESEVTDGYDWRKSFLDIYGIKTLVDVNGDSSNPPYQDFDDQADMCEIIRALIGNGYFSFGNSLENISLEILDSISCPGALYQSQICAATAQSYPNKASWVIMILGESLKINEFPKYIVKRNVGDNKNKSENS